MTDDELSAAVADALGLPAGDSEAPRGGFAIDLRAGTCRDIPALVSYATDWNAAGLVIETMGRRGWDMECTIFADDGTASVVFYRGDPQCHRSPDVPFTKVQNCRESDSFPRAVCLAALAAVDASHD